MEKKKSKSSLELTGSHRFYISQKCFNVNIVASSNNFLVILYFGSFKTTYVKKFSYSLKLLIEDKGSIFLLVCLSLPRSPEGTLLNLANDERTQIVQVTSFQMRGRDAKGCVFLPSLFPGILFFLFPQYSYFTLSSYIIPIIV